jgi:hypothetical protein
VLYSVNGTLVERVESCSRPSTFSRQPKRSYRKLNVEAVSTISFLTTDKLAEPVNVARRRRRLKLEWC